MIISGNNMASSPQMYDNGLENLKKAAITVKVRSYLNGSSEIDPADLENPELSLDLQSLIDDPNFEVTDGLFPELLQEKHQALLSSHKGAGSLIEYSQLRHNNNNNHNSGPQHHHVHSTNGGGGNSGSFARNPLAYMPQPVHGGSSFNNSSNNNSNSNNVNSTTSGTHGGNNNGPDILVKEEPMDQHRSAGTDFSGNGVSSSEQASSSSYGSSSYSNPLSNVTSPSSSSSQGYSPNAYIHPNHHGLMNPGLGLPGHGHGHDGGGLIVTKSGGLAFNSKGLHNHGHHGHHHSSSKKLKNVDKASDEYKRRRERNNIAVRKSREKAKIRSKETEERVKILCKENDRLQKKIELLTEELTFLRSFFSNVGGLPEQIHREFNKHLETFQHHHIQNGIHLQ